MVTEAFRVLHGVEDPYREASFPAEEELNRSQWVGLEIRENGSIPFPNYTYQNATPSFTWVFIVFTSDVEAGHAGDVLVCNEEIRCSVVASSTPLAPLRETAERAVS